MMLTPRFGSSGLRKRRFLIERVDLANDLRNEPARPAVVDSGAIIVLPKDEVPIDELLPLTHLPFEDRPKIGRIADDIGREEEKKIRLSTRLFGLSEERTEDGDIAKDGDLRLARRLRIAHQPADDNGLLIAHHHLGRRDAAVDRDDSERTLGCSALRDLLFDLAPELIGVVDNWRHAERRADVP